jgi:hypothetical protein
MKGFLDVVEKFISVQAYKCSEQGFALVEFGFIAANLNLNFKGSTMGSRMESCSKKVI